MNGWFCVAYLQIAEEVTDFCSILGLRQKFQAIENLLLLAYYDWEENNMSFPITSSDVGKINSGDYLSSSF